MGDATDSCCGRESGAVTHFLVAFLALRESLMRWTIRMMTPKSSYRHIDCFQRFYRGTQAMVGSVRVDGHSSSELVSRAVNLESCT